MPEVEAEASPRQPHAHAPDARGPQREKGGRGSLEGDAVHHRPVPVPTVDHACGLSPVLAHDYDVAEPQLATCPARTGPTQARQSPFET
jgi:hypothetical protein